MRHFQIKCKFFFKYSSLPILILILSIMLNSDKYDDSLFKGLVHSILQALFIYGLFAAFKKQLIIRIIFSFMLIISLFTQLSYGAPLSVSIIMSVLNTSVSEAFSFIQFNSVPVFISISSFFGMVFFKTYSLKFSNKAFIIIGLSYIIIPTFTLAQLSFSSKDYKGYHLSGVARGLPDNFIAAEYIIDKMSWRFPPLKNIRGITDTVTLLMQQRNNASSWSDVSSSGSNNLLVIGIGESLRAGNMGLYGYIRNTTPRLSSIKSEFDVYSRTYAAGTNTWSSVPASLTKSNVDLDLSKSIINLAKDAGYETFWFSNQGKYSKWDFSVSSIAEQADHLYFSSDEKGGGEHDSILLKKLQQELNSPVSIKPRLIILHYYGSHSPFSERYPTEYSYFNGDTPLLDQYDNSVLYTDFIQHEVINMVAKYDGKYIFFADHGLGEPQGDMALKHDVRSNPNIESLKVPLLIYPKATLNINTESTVSLYYFECIFSEWAKISALELRNGYCDRVLNKKSISFIDANLRVREVVTPDLL